MTSTLSKFIFLLSAISVLSTSHSCQACLINLFNYSGGEYPSFKWTWTHSEDAHSIEEWNDGSTNENFFNARFVFNIVRVSDGTELSWDVSNKYFTDGIRIVYITNYDGEFDNTGCAISNMKEGIWPYYDFDTLWAGGEHVIRNFEVTGASWSRLEGDTIANVMPIPEPLSFLLFATGLVGAIAQNRKIGGSKAEIS